MYRRFPRLSPTVAVLLGLAAVACGESETQPLGPGQTLTGHWKADNVAFDATASGATLRQPCAEADFGPLVLDDSLHIAAVSTRYVITGNARTYPDEELSLSGTLDSSGDLRLTLLPVSDSLQGVDPYALDLAPGTLPGTPVCTAARIP